MGVKYSPLCATSESAYLAYLRTVTLEIVERHDNQRRLASRDGGDAAQQLGCESSWRMGAYTVRVGADGIFRGVEVSGRSTLRLGGDCEQVGDAGSREGGERREAEVVCSGEVEVGERSVPTVEDDVAGSGESGVDERGADSSSSEESETDSGVVVGTERGKHYLRNKAKRERVKELKWRARAGMLPSKPHELSSNWRRPAAASWAGGGGSVCTVDTRTGVEIEAAQTLAARRVAENKLAVEKAEAERLLTQHRIRALKDKDRTKAVEKLAATRMEEKINKAKKSSEEAYKSCESSLKSLGSTGSAGEFALKQQIKDARETELLLKYTRAQADMYAIYATPDVLAKVAALPPPVFQDEFDAFGDCPDYYTEAERQQYYDDLNRRNAEKIDYADTGDAW